LHAPSRGQRRNRQNQRNNHSGIITTAVTAINALRVQNRTNDAGNQIVQVYRRESGKVFHLLRNNPVCRQQPPDRNIQPVLPAPKISSFFRMTSGSGTQFIEDAVLEHPACL
jgi:hypothetical protein